MTWATLNKYGAFTSPDNDVVEIPLSKNLKGSIRFTLFECADGWRWNHSYTFGGIEAGTGLAGPARLADRAWPSRRHALGDAWTDLLMRAPAAYSAAIDRARDALGKDGPIYDVRGKGVWDGKAKPDKGGLFPESACERDEMTRPDPVRFGDYSLQCIRLAQAEDGWRWGLSIQQGSGVESTRPSVEDRPLPTRHAALVDALLAAVNVFRGKATAEAAHHKVDAIIAACKKRAAAICDMHKTADPAAEPDIAEPHPATVTRPAPSSQGEDVERYMELPTADLHPSAGNPRKTFDEHALAELAASIRSHGVLQPLLVRPAPAANGQYEIVCGERRWRAAKLAELARVPARVRNDLTDDQVLEIQVIENSQRADVLPMEEAEGFAALLTTKYSKMILTDAVGLIAGKIGKPMTYVHQRLKLNDLVPEAKERLRAGTFLVGHANLLARLAPEAQAEVLAWVNQPWQARSTPTVASMDEWIRRELVLDLKKAPFKLDDAELLPAAGACTNCPKCSGTCPTLFADMQSNVCTDRACFDAKVDASIAAKVKKAQDKGKPIVLVDGTWGAEPTAEGVLKHGQFRESKKGECEATSAAINAGGYEKGKSLFVCTDPKCAVHGFTPPSAGGRASSRSDEDRKKEKARKDEMKYRAALVEQVWESEREPATDDHWVIIAAAFLDDIGSETFKRLVFLGLPEDGGYARPKLLAWLREQGGAGCRRVLMTAALARKIGISVYGSNHGRDKELDGVAKTFGIDVDAVRAEAIPKKGKSANKRGE